jgi:hypothetical protein
MILCGLDEGWVADRARGGGSLRGPLRSAAVSGASLISSPGPVSGTQPHPTCPWPVGVLAIPQTSHHPGIDHPQAGITLTRGTSPHQARVGPHHARPAEVGDTCARHPAGQNDPGG